MKKRHFYSHIVETSSISLSLGEMDLTPKERKELIHLAEITMHKTIMDLVLSHLSEEDKRQFLLHVANNHHERVWNLLKEKIDNIEEKIEKAAHDMKKQLHKDVEEAKRKG